MRDRVYSKAVLSMGKEKIERKGHPTIPIGKEKERRGMTGIPLLSL
jgi:hypothetical protein